VLADGSSSNGEFAGVAPETKLYFQSLLDPNGGLGGLPVSLEGLFEPAYQAGARIHNNSWGAATASAYTVDSNDVDAYAAERRDMLIVSGRQRGNRRRSIQFRTWLRRLVVDRLASVVQERTHSGCSPQQP
jgi:Subtilase family